VSTTTAIRTVAVLDDDLPFIRMVERVLAEASVTVSPVTTPDPEDASAVVAQLAPDLALVDVFFYGHAAGFELIERIRSDARTADLPLLVTSGARREVARHVEFLQRQRCGVLLKPFDPDDLLARLDDIGSAGPASAPGAAPLREGTLPSPLRFGWLHR
jgi:DNA-binding response OmpR family regulator